MITIEIDMGKRCAECNEEGAAPNGLCIRCTSKALCGDPMKSAVGKAVAKRAAKRHLKSCKGGKR